MFSISLPHYHCFVFRRFATEEVAYSHNIGNITTTHRPTTLVIITSNMLPYRTVMSRRKTTSTVRSPAVLVPVAGSQQRMAKRNARETRSIPGIDRTSWNWWSARQRWRQRRRPRHCRQQQARRVRQQELIPRPPACCRRRAIPAMQAVAMVTAVAERNSLTVCQTI